MKTKKTPQEIDNFVLNSAAKALNEYMDKQTFSFYEINSMGITSEVLRGSLARLIEKGIIRRVGYNYAIDIVKELS